MVDRPADGSDNVRPLHIDLEKTRALTIQWSDGRVSIYPIAYLRKMSPSAEMRELREEMGKNPLTVLPEGFSRAETLSATGAELVGNYALRVRFSDDHSTGLYTWRYLLEIDPGNPHAAQPDERIRP